jgi:integrase
MVALFRSFCLSSKLCPFTEVNTYEKAPRSQNSSEQKNTHLNARSVQEVSKPNGHASGRHPKTDVRYWEAAIFQPTYKWDGEVRRVGEWAAKIQHLGRRETFSLGGANKASAAARAKEIYLSLRAIGWDATIAKFKPKAGSAGKAVATVGEFLEEVKAKASARPKTIESYSRAFRTIVADIYGIDGGKSKYDYRKGGRELWVRKVHGVRIAAITPAEVQKWKLRFLRRAGTDPIKQRAARVSVNSLMRQAKSLFAPAVLKFVSLELPAASPFAGVSFEPRQSMKYRSGFNVEKLIEDAQKELPVEQLKILLLALMVGLRRNEIDKLEWAAFRWEEGIIRIEATRYFHPKSEDSVGDVDIDAELLKVFRGFHARGKSHFVIDSPIAPRPDAMYSHYRCQRHFETLTAWLRDKGVTGNKPLHTLRKEFGSQVCAKHGIYAASNALRHADIAITSQHYLDKKRRATVGLGRLLLKPSNVVAINTRTNKLSALSAVQ